MNIFYAIPSANAERCTGTFAKWKDRGYHTAALIDGSSPSPGNCDVLMRVDQYPGWPSAENMLMQHLVNEHDAIICIGGGDDMWPDPHLTPDEIAAPYAEGFPNFDGVMQPTGDQYGEINNCCDSPWIGREWILNGNGGRGAFWPEYQHFFCTAELQIVTTKLGKFWQRPDIIQYHDHFIRNGSAMTDYQERARSGPWSKDQQLFERRKEMGFPVK